MGTRGKNSTRVGGVHVDVDADTTGLDQSLTEGEQRVEQFLDKVATETKKAGGSFSAMSDRISAAIGKKIGAFTSLLGSVTAVVAVFTLFLVIGKKVGDMLFRTADTAKQLEIRMNAVEAATERYVRLVIASIPPGEDPLALKAMLARLVELQAEIAKTQEELDAFVFSGASAPREAMLRERISELRAEEKKTIDLSEAFRKRAEAATTAEKNKAKEEATRERVAQIERESRALEDSLLAPIQRAQAETMRAQEVISRMIAETEDEGIKEALRKRLEVEATVGAARVFALEEAHRKEAVLEEKSERKRQQAIEKQANATATAMAKAITSALNRGIATSEARMNRLILTAERVFDSVERLRRRMNP